MISRRRAIQIDVTFTFTFTLLRLRLSLYFKFPKLGLAHIFRGSGHLLHSSVKCFLDMPTNVLFKLVHI